MWMLGDGSDSFESFSFGRWPSEVWSKQTLPSSQLNGFDSMAARSSSPPMKAGKRSYTSPIG